MASVASAQKISSITIEGNSKTTDETILLIADIKVGDKFKADQVSQIQADLVDSGLFKHVEVSYVDAKKG
ncbi:MAG: FtsQ-type POTRA domain-containing protein, partial [Myxococcota bacterium]